MGIIETLKLFFAKLFSSSSEEDLSSSSDYGYEEEDDPFIKPFDFYIEADHRYNDEKTFTVENVRSFDILKVLDEMDLAYDVINYLGVRKKLKRLFDDLAFDISDYVTYEGGRTVENFAYEEIDDVELEISVYISKQSDSSPFVVSVRISNKGVYENGT